MPLPAVTAAAWPLLFLLPVLLREAAAQPQPWQCAPCTQEKLAQCAPVPASCQEQARPYGCGCCPLCSLRQGDNCGMTSARCASGLSCQLRPGETRPLRALARGRGVCKPEIVTDPSAEAIEAEEESPSEVPPAWSALSNYASIKALGISDFKNWKYPCQKQLYEVLNKLAQEQQQRAGDGIYKFYLPNCHKEGWYHAEQCETSLHGERGLCWCVYPWDGRRIEGSQKVMGDPNCDQYFDKKGYIASS